MKGASKVKKHNNAPIQAPLYPDPFVPYECKNNRSLQAVCEVEEEIIRSYLKLTPFEYVDNKMIISITDFMNCDKVPFMDCAFVVPVKYKETYGGYYLFEYENHDSAIAAGRELWGYPKKYATIKLERDRETIYGEVMRQGNKILSLSCNLKSAASDFQGPKVVPHLNIRCIPRPGGPGLEMMQIIERDTSPDFQLKEEHVVEMNVEINSTSQDPLADFIPTKVLGGSYIVGDFYATEENGWGKVIYTESYL
jgi:acetoacetate decarboxylase